MVVGAGARRAGGWRALRTRSVLDGIHTRRVGARSARKSSGGRSWLDGWRPPPSSSIGEEEDEEEDDEEKKAVAGEVVVFEVAIELTTAAMEALVKCHGWVEST